MLYRYAFKSLVGRIGRADRPGYPSFSDALVPSTFCYYHVGSCAEVVSARGEPGGGHIGSLNENDLHGGLLCEQQMLLASEPPYLFFKNRSETAEMGHTSDTI